MEVTLGIFSQRCNGGEVNRIWLEQLACLNVNNLSFKSLMQFSFSPIASFLHGESGS